MSNEVIFWTQIASIVAFVFVLFGLYRLLVDQKEATIQLLRETITTLKDQLSEARSATPDVLAKTLSDRVMLLEGELERLAQDSGENQELIHNKELELKATRLRAEDLTKQVTLAQKLLGNFLCPHCNAPLAAREYHSESVEYQGRDCDIDHEFSEYECGYSVIDGTEHSPCRAKTARSVSVVTSA